MKRIIAVIFIILLSGCMSADPRESRFTASMKEFNWDYERALDFENNTFRIRMVPSKDSGTVFDHIANSYAVDKESSARRYLFDNYDVYLLELKNKTQAEQIFYLDKLYLVCRDVTISTVSPVDLPSEIRRINPKGISKNMYNSVVVITVLAAISSALITLGNENLRPSGLEADVLSAPEIWSGVFHKTRLKYEDLILNQNPIGPNKSKSGIVFVSRGGCRIKNCTMIYE